MDNNTGATAGIRQGEQRRVLGLLRSLYEEDPARAVEDRAALAPVDESDARALLDAALVLLGMLTGDPRLGGRDEEIARLTKLSLVFETKYGMP
ncbi:hypothetical protein ACIQF8_01270 [Pseudarthrobacter sp. NPDC092184]|uniref:hypothetical protein n=1 Tax=unclassified Pseudarthrobacter TaxID=2647000 RepID=UPI0037FBF833